MSEYWGAMLLDAEEPPLLVCQRCREEFYQRSASPDQFCEDCQRLEDLHESICLDADREGHFE